MENNYNVDFNPKKYEKHLSPFGNKVLAVLMKQWGKARVTQNNSEYQRSQFPAQNKRVLTFIDDTVVSSPYKSPPTLILPTSCVETLHLQEKSFNVNLTDKTVPDVPKSVELINTISPKINDEHDFLHPTVAANKNLVHNFYQKDFDDNDSYIPFVEEAHSNNMNKAKSKDINWDDMLDSELLVSMTTNEKENKGPNLDKIFETKFPKENTSKTEITTFEKKIDMTKGQKRKIKKKAEPKTKKIRSDDDVTINQSVEQLNKNINLRKQRYTKTVKNWLDNVEPHHPVDEDLGNILSTSDVDLDIAKSIDQNAPSSETPVTHSENVCINKSLKTTKKVVQAQLANKDGVMKFRKPRQIGDEIKKGADVVETKPKENKEKKVKKFVAPIKSQIPVKDVTFEICSIDEDNFENNRDFFREIQNNEILVVLIFNNGFCQLNSHHTDDTCFPDGVIINHNDMFYCFKGTSQNIKETLNHLLVNNKVVCYGARSVLIHLATHLQIDINLIDIYDAKIGASLLDPDNSPENFSDLQKLLSFSAPYTIATECPLQKTAWYMTLLRECWAKLSAMLVDEALWKVFVEIEMKLLPIIADMERRGICIDMVKLKSMEEVLVSRMKLVEQQCYQAAGKVFQINSAEQVRSILYDELQLDAKCHVKIRETTCKGAKSTSETMLRSLMSEHPLPKLILEYRHLHKAHATFLAGIAVHVKDGVVRPTWVQTAAATGRIACNNPNLQAIPKTPFSLVMFPDPGDDVDCSGSRLLFRSVYVARAGRTLLGADFQHVECRVFAHAAHDAGLLRALALDTDLFKVLAAQWLKKPEADISAEERERTKRLVYASLYGAGTRTLMDILGEQHAQALQVAASFNRSFPSLKSFGRDVVSRCVSNGGRLSTPSGRVRRVAHIASDHAGRRAHAERQAVNFIVQGSAADLCKSAMVACARALRDTVPRVRARLVLQIHDELVWEVDDSHVPRAAAIIKEVMEGCGQHCGMAVSLPVVVSVGRDWGHMQPYTLHAD